VQHVGEARLSPWMGCRLDGGGVGARRRSRLKEAVTVGVDQGGRLSVGGSGAGRGHRRAMSVGEVGRA
jgi:hypothetical protein